MQSIFENANLLLEPSELGVHRSLPGTVLLEHCGLALDGRLLTSTESFQLQNALVVGDAVLSQLLYHGSSLGRSGPRGNSVPGTSLNGYAARTPDTH